jgi:hypothetical protein
MTPGQLATEEAMAARTVAAYAMVRATLGATLARDTWTMARILDRWATGPGTEGMDSPLLWPELEPRLPAVWPTGIETAPSARRTRR